MWQRVTRQLWGPWLYCLNTCYTGISGQPCVGRGWGRRVATAAANDVNSSSKSKNNGCFLYINSSRATTDSVGKVLVEFSFTGGDALSTDLLEVPRRENSRAGALQPVLSPSGFRCR